MRYAVIITILIAVALLIIFRKQLSDLAGGSNNTPSASGGSGSGAVTPVPGSTSTGLDYTKVLKRGSTGGEVKLLQYLLGVTTDGQFGPKTEAALLAKKGVKEITLYQYYVTADAVTANTNYTNNFSWFNF